MKVLVLDDHKGFRDEIVDMLERNGHQAACAATAEEAIPLAESGDYAFVLVDYSMPGRDGMWFMKNVNLPRRTKALLTTAHADRQMINRMFAAGVCGYIIKPFYEDDLLRHLTFHSRASAVRARAECAQAMPAAGIPTAEAVPACADPAAERTQVMP